MESITSNQQTSSPSVKNTTTEKIAILDCGAQYTKVIDRRVRELKVATQIFPLDIDPVELEGFSAIILSGGPNSVYAEGSPQPHPNLFQTHIPILGICYGMQLINLHFGGEVRSSEKKEYGETQIDVEKEGPLFSSLDFQQMVLMSHGDSVKTVAPGFEVIAQSSEQGQQPIIAAIANPEQKVYGVQFHPEVELTENGTKILSNFLYEVCGLKGTFVLEDRLDKAVQQIQKQVGDKNVFVLVSGGVDSTVTAALLLKALGPEKVLAVHVDSGFMRKNESNEVCEALKTLGLKNLRRIDAADTFANAYTEIGGKTVGPLKAAIEPEVKRRIIGDVFFQLAQQAMEEADFDINGAFIAQGTLRPDLIESGSPSVSATASKIKTHHNDVPIIQEHREKGLIIEPNKDWHKDEVRQVGKLLGLPEPLVMRQPFPGPGLAVRVLCVERPYVTQQSLTTHEKLKEYIEPYLLTGAVLPVQSVGVQGDERTYSHLAVLANEEEIQDWDHLYELAKDIPNHLHQVNRVAFVLNKPQAPGFIESITSTTLTAQIVEKLRNLDHIVTQAFTQAGLLSDISQLLTVLVPVDTTNQGGHSVAIRAVVTSDFMTARPARIGREIPTAFIRELSSILSAQTGVDMVLYDVTGKPPATVEWE